MVSTTQSQEEPLPGEAKEPKQRCLDLSVVPKCAAPEGTGANIMSNMQNPEENGRCQGQVEGTKA